MFFFAYDSVMDWDEPQKLKYLLRACRKYNCELWYWGVETSEGYVVQRYVISATTEEDWVAFAGDIAKDLPNSEWFSLSPEDEMRLTSPTGERVISVQEELQNYPGALNSEIDGWSSIAKYNAELKQKLETETPLYFTYEWELPSNEDACRTWLEAALESLWKLSRGCAIRLASDIRSHQDRYIQTLVLRVFSLEELEAQKANTASTNADWKSAPAEIFLKAEPLYPNSIGLFLAQIQWN